MLKAFVGRDEKRELLAGQLAGSSDYGMLRPRLPDNEVKSDVQVDRPVFQKRNAASLKLLSAPFEFLRVWPIQPGP